LPERILGPPSVRPEWTRAGENEDQVGELLDWIADFKKARITGALVVFSWVDRCSQPLQKRTNFSFQYLGLKDPSRFSAESLSMMQVKRVLMDVDTVPYLPKKLFRASHSLAQVGVSSI